MSSVTRIVRYTFIVILTLIILLLIWQFGVAIGLFLLSLAVTAALRPLINAITGRKVPKRLALGIVYALLVAGIISSLLLISPRLLEDVQRASDDLIANYDRAKTEWPARGTSFQKALAEQMPPSTDFYKALTSQEGVPVLTGVFGIAQNFFSSLGQLAIVIMLSLYWSADQFRFERLALSTIPKEHHTKALHVWRSVENGVGEYLRSEIIQSILAGLLLWMGYSVLGIRYPVLLALWGAFARLIPWFGALIAVLPALIIGTGVSSILGIIAMLYTVGVLLAMELVIEPRFFPRYRYSSLLIILVVVALAGTFGFLGVVLAPPLAVALQILFQHLYPTAAPAVSSEALVQTTEIQERLFQLKRRLDGSANRDVVRLIERLNRLVNRASESLQGE